MSDLKPCPFCGGKAELHRKVGSWGYYPDRLSVGCTSCGFRLLGQDTERWERGRGTFDVTPEATEAAIAAWNRRAR